MPFFVYNSERGDSMNDQKIIELLFARSETALAHIQAKFEKYCHMISYNILGNDHDAQECVNDTYLRIWNSIPPNQPENLSVYIGHVTRNLSIDVIKKNGGYIIDLEITKNAKEGKNPCAVFSLQTPRKVAHQHLMTKIANLDGVISVEEL